MENPIKILTRIFQALFFGSMIALLAAWFLMDMRIKTIKHCYLGENECKLELINARITNIN